MGKAEMVNFILLTSFLVGLLWNIYSCTRKKLEINIYTHQSNTPTHLGIADQG